MDKPKIVTLAKGQSCTGHMMPIGKAVLFENIPSSELNKAPDATHALTIRYRKDIDKGDMIEYGRHKLRVINAFDPYGPANRPSLGNLGRNVSKSESHPQAGKWVICLVREKIGD